MRTKGHRWLTAAMVGSMLLGSAVSLRQNARSQTVVAAQSDPQKDEPKMSFDLISSAHAVYDWVDCGPTCTKKEDCVSGCYGTTRCHNGHCQDKSH
jgi:hypothetical protein